MHSGKNRLWIPICRLIFTSTQPIPICVNIIQFYLLHCGEGMSHKHEIDPRGFIIGFLHHHKDE